METKSYFMTITQKYKILFPKSYIFAIYKKVGILEKNQKPKVNINGGIIYILKALNSDTTLYKLGKTSNLKNRLKTYNSSNANDIEPLFILSVKDIDSVESCIKKDCKKFQYRKYKKVYEIYTGVLKEVMEDCNEFVNHLALKLKDKTEGKIIKDKIMKKKQDKYFIYISKNNK